MKRLYFITLLFIVLFSLLVCGCAAKKRIPSGDENRVSPPGFTQQLGKVAYVNQGQLFVRNLDKRSSVQITTYQNVYYPKWSPSGKWLLFQRGHELWISKEDGAATRMVAPETQSFTWLARKDSICYATKEEGLVLATAEGGLNQVLLKPPGELRLPHIASSPDGKSLAVEIEGSGLKGALVSQGLGIISLSTGKFTSVQQGASSTGSAAPGNATSDNNTPDNTPGNRLRLAGWSADGQTVYAWNGPVSASITADGVSFSGFNALSGQSLLPDTKGLNHSGWYKPSPQGEMAALITGTSRETWVNKTLTLIDLKNNQYLQLSKPNTTVNSFSFSPNGKLLALSAGREEKRFYEGAAMDYGSMAQMVMADRHIYTTTLDGKKQFQLTKDSVYRDEYPQWNAKGDYLLFTRVDSRQNASLWSISKEGKDLKSVVPQLTPFDWFGYYGYIDWQQYFDYFP